MVVRFIRVILFLLVIIVKAHAQSVYVPLDHDYDAITDRLEILSGQSSGAIFSAVKPYLRKDVAQFADHLANDTTKHFSKVDQKNLEYLRDDNWEWSTKKDAGNTSNPFLRYWYEKKNAFYQVNNLDFQLQINPVALFGFGKDNALASGVTDNSTLSSNTRGFELRGQIDNKVGFYTLLTDNQIFFPTYVNTRIAATSAIPGEGFWKVFKNNGTDFFSSSGYIDFKITKHIDVQFGQGKNFIGNGYRSLELSDYSNNYLFLKIDTKIWKFDYVNIFAQMVADDLGNGGDVNDPRKFMALHYLSYNVTSKFSLGFFECITFGNTDTLHNRTFDPNYLNPIIFYKAVENGLGAPDKDHIGIDFKWNLFRRVSLYGTVFIDEFNIDELRANTGWWANKQAAQLGIKYIDAFGLHNFDLQGEGNVVPPYTYTHFSFSNAPNNNYANYANYSNYDQPLADPNGANFYELIGIARYQPCYRLSLTLKGIYTIIGLDEGGKDYGSNVLLNSNNRVGDYGNYITQGARTDITYLSAAATYRLMHNMFVDLTCIKRNETSQLASYNSHDNILTLTFRWNIAQRLNEF